MFNKRLIFVVAIAVMFLSLIFIFCFRESNRSHAQLQSLLEEIEGGTAMDGIQWASLERKPRQLEAAEKIRALGTNSIPFLLQEIQVRGASQFSFFQRVRRFIVEKILRRNLGGPRPVSIFQTRRWRAALALEALGPEIGSQIIPTLTPLLTEAGSDSRCKDAALVLANAGPAGIAILTNTIVTATNRRNWGQICAIWALGQHPEHADTNWVPLFINAAQSDKSGQYSPFRYAVPWALGQIKLDPPRSLAYLTNLLADPFPFGHASAATALTNFAKEAIGAIPLLQRALQEPQTKWAAEQTLEKIDPNWKPK